MSRESEKPSTRPKIDQSVHRGPIDSRSEPVGRMFGRRALGYEGRLRVYVLCSPGRKTFVDVAISAGCDVRSMHSIDEIIRHLTAEQNRFSCVVVDAVPIPDRLELL